MNTSQFLADLQRRGVDIRADGDKLRVSAPAGALVDLDRQALIEYKPALLELLRRPTPEDVADLLNWGALYLWPAIGTGPGGPEVDHGQDAWLAFADGCTASDLTDLRRVAYWQPGEREVAEGEDALKGTNVP